MSLHKSAQSSPSSTDRLREELMAITSRYGAWCAKHGTGYFEHMPKDTAVVNQLEALITKREVAARMDELKLIDKLRRAEVSLGAAISLRIADLTKESE